jgi:hypothetical protein
VLAALSQSGVLAALSQSGVLAALSQSGVLAALSQSGVLAALSTLLMRRLSDSTTAALRRRLATAAS